MKNNHKLCLSFFIILIFIILIILQLALDSEGKNNIESYSNKNIINSCVEGLIKKTCDGYTLITPRYDSHPLLIDMDGREIHEWSINGFPAKMFPGGSIIGARIYREEFNNLGRKGTLYKYISQEDWNGTITWEFCNWSNDWALQHHDFHRVGSPVYYSPVQKTNVNSNTLILARIEKIWNKSISWCPLQDDVIYEIDSNGYLTGFEWHANEHFNEFGFDILAKIGLFLCPGGQGWLHINTCAEVGNNKWYQQGYTQFNPSNIIICSRNANFIAIINKTDGNIVWKIGPDFNKEPENKLGEIIGPHCAHMIPEGLPGEGNMLIFDNGGFSGYGLLGGLFNSPIRYHRFYSRVIEFNPVTLDVVWEYKQLSDHHFPIKDENRFFSIIISSAQRLPNGNTLITEGTSGRIFEVTSEKEIVWEYAYSGEGYSLQNDYVYRAYRVPPEWVPGNPSGYTYWAQIENT